MPILESKLNQSEISRCLMAAGWGTILGFQVCWLAECGFGASIPWYGRAWIVLSHVFLGFSIAATEPLMRWWKQGLLLGLAVISIPTTLGAYALGLKFVPFGIAAIAEGLADGLFLALILKALFPRAPPADEHCPCSGRLRSPHHAESEEYDSYLTYQRLAEEKACLEHLEAEREYPGNSDFGKTTEDRIIWKELLDLELQDIDEQVSRICRTAEDAVGSSHGIEQHPRRAH